MIQKKTNRWYSKPNLGLKGMFMSFLYLLLLMTLAFFLITDVVGAAKLDSSYGSSYLKNIGIAFSKFLDNIKDPVSIFVILGIPVIWSIMIHKSFSKSILVLVGLYVISIVSSEMQDLEVAFMIFFFFPTLFLSLLGIVMRAYYNIQSVAIRLSILIAPPVLLILAIFVSLL